MPLLSRLSFIQLCKETTQGTAASSSPIYIPVQDATGEELPHYVEDDSLANNASLIRGVYQGERDSTFTYNGFLYPDVVGYHMVSAGFSDSYSASGASSGTHTFRVPAAGTQPPSYTIGDFDNVAFRQWAGQVLDQWDVTLDGKGALKHTAKWLGWTSASASKPTPAWTAMNPYMGWQATATIGGIGVTRMISAGFTIKRSTEVIHTLGNTQNPYNVFAGPVDSRIKFQAVVEDYTDWNHLINNDQPTVVVTVTDTQASSGAGGIAPVLTFTSTSEAFVKGVLNRKGKYMVLDVDITSIQNATDVGPLTVTQKDNHTSTY